MTGNWENSGKLGESKTERERGPFESNDYILIGKGFRSKRFHKKKLEVFAFSKKRKRKRTNPKIALP